MKVFFLTILGVTTWQFLPEYVFPMLSSLAFLCWVAPKNATANFIGAGLGGMGFLNLSLDWSNVGNLSQMGSLFVTPWYTQVIVFLAFVVNCWFLLPLAKWGGLGSWHPQLMSNRPFLCMLHYSSFHLDANGTQTMAQSIQSQALLRQMVASTRQHMPNMDRST